MGTYEYPKTVEEIMGSNPSQHECSECPVTNVHGQMCRFYRKAECKNRQHFRLPTEAEWEYAARVA